MVTQQPFGHFLEGEDLSTSQDTARFSYWEKTAAHGPRTVEIIRSIANDGNEFTLRLCGTEVTDNVANEGGGGIFFVSNNRTGNLNINDSLLCNNDSLGFETSGYPGIFVLASGDPSVSGSSLEDVCP